MIELTKGQETALAGEDGRPLTRVRMGLGWDKNRTAGFIGSGAPDVDLDATAVQYAGGQLFDLAFYNNLQTRTGRSCTSATTSPAAARATTRRITVDLGRVHGPGGHDRLPGEQLPGPLARVDRQRLLPAGRRRRRRRRRAGAVHAHRRRTRDRAGDGQAVPGRRTSGGSARSARGSPVTVPTKSLESLQRFLYPQTASRQPELPDRDVQRDPLGQSRRPPAGPRGRPGRPGRRAARST